jgi:hypothetical protein
MLLLLLLSPVIMSLCRFTVVGAANEIVDYVKVIVDDISGA